jgi:hypothetical protein
LYPAATCVIDEIVPDDVVRHIPLDAVGERRIAGYTCISKPAVLDYVAVPITRATNILMVPVTGW